MKTFTIRGYHNYRVHEDGRFYIGSCAEPSNQWKVLGAVRRNNFGSAVEYLPFPDCMDIKDWRHKNGSAKWHLRDLDHGTMREWGETIIATWENAL